MASSSRCVPSNSSRPSTFPDCRSPGPRLATSEVRAGDLVVKFDSSASQQQLLEKEAALKQAQAALDQAITETKTTAQQDVLDVANAQVTVDKATLEASKEEIVSRLQAEESKIDLGVAEQKLRAQEATDSLHTHASDGKVASLTRQRDKAQQDIDITKERLAKMEMRAPSPGVVVYLNNYSSGWINAKPFKVGDQAWGGSGIAELPDLSTLALKGKLEEIDRGRITVGQDVRITVDPFPEKIYAGKLSAISPRGRAVLPIGRPRATSAPPAASMTTIRACVPA